MHDFLLLLAGFALTTVAGGLLGYWLQGRTWRHQERNRLRQAELQSARAFYEELSRLLDRRLHRMRQLDARLDRTGEEQEVERLLGGYREVLDEWNDNLNRNLALAVSYFGKPTHAALEHLYEGFSRAGAEIEARVREYRRDGTASSPPATRSLRRLDLVIYDLNLAMLDALQHESVGAAAGDGAGAGGAAARLADRVAG